MAEASTPSAAKANGPRAQGAAQRIGHPGDPTSVLSYYIRDCRDAGVLAAEPVTKLRRWVA